MVNVACRKPKNNPNETKLVSRCTGSFGYTQTAHALAGHITERSMSTKLARVTGACDAKKNAPNHQARGVSYCQHYLIACVKQARVARPGMPVLDATDQADLRRRAAAMPTRPKPRIASEAGSGTSVAAVWWMTMLSTSRK